MVYILGILMIVELLDYVFIYLNFGGYSCILIYLELLGYDLIAFGARLGYFKEYHIPTIMGPKNIRFWCGHYCNLIYSFDLRTQ